MFGGEVEHLVCRFDPGQVVRLAALGLARAEAQEGVEVVGFPAHGLEPPVQLGAVAVARQHGAAVTPGSPPEHPVEQAPAVLLAEACGLGQQFRQFARDAHRAAWGAPRGGVEAVEEAGIRRPVHLVRGDPGLQQAPGFAAPAFEAAVEAGPVHHQSAICAGASPSWRRRAVDSRSASRGL